MEYRYEDIGPYSDEEIRACLRDDDPDELRVLIVGVALYHNDPDLAGQLCEKLAAHDNEEVRGNAVLGFGHLARRFRQLDEPSVRPLLEHALADPSAYVRGQAHAAVDDVKHFLGWDFAQLD